MTEHQIELVKLSAKALEALVRGDIDAASAEAGVPLTGYLAAEAWLWRVRLEQIASDSRALDWIARAALDRSSGDVVGHAGFHGPPDERGMVEVGYGVDPDHRRQGYARAALGVMVERARADASVTVVRASVGPWNEASRTLVESCGFVEVGEQWDDEDGLQLVFERPARGGPVGRPAGGGRLSACL